MSDKFSIEFYTPELPAPHAFAIQLDAEKKDQTLQTNFSLQYMDRDSCTSDEILEEGFTGNDDINWQGNLNLAWTKAFQTAIKNLKTEKEEKNHHIFFRNDGNLNSEKTGFTSNEELEYLLKELHQAVLEDLQTELPLSIHIQEFEQNTKILDLSCIASFWERKAILIVNKDGTDHQIEIDWDTLTEFMTVLYSKEFDQEKAIKKVNQAKGMYIEMGTDLWIPIKGKEKDTIKTAIQKIINLD
jgi:hypothetical protein